MNGKGSKQRPRQVSAGRYAHNWERTFREMECKCTGLGTLGCPAHDDSYEPRSLGDDVIRVFRRLTRTR